MKADFWSWDHYDSEARRLYDEGNYDAARELLEQGLSIHPASAELRVSLGYAELAREEFAWARRWFQEALDLEPDHEEALLGLAEVLLKMGERGRAFLALGRLLELGFGEDPDLMLSAGRALHREGLHERALGFLRRALEADPECAEASAELACALYHLGDPEGAEEACRRALELEPELHEARAFLGNLLYDRADLAAALAQFERVPPREVWDPLVAWRAAELLKRVGGLPEDDPLVAPYVRRLEELTLDPSPEDQLLAEVEAIQEARSTDPGLSDLGQLDLFGWIAYRRRAGTGPEAALHEVRLPDGRRYCGNWLGIVRALRDDSTDPTISVVDFMEEEARRLQELTGVRVPHDDPRAFLEAAARLGVLQIHVDE